MHRVDLKRYCYLTVGKQRKRARLSAMIGQYLVRVIGPLDVKLVRPASSQQVQRSNLLHPHARVKLLLTRKATATQHIATNEVNSILESNETNGLGRQIHTHGSIAIGLQLRLQLNPKPNRSSLGST